MAELPMRYATQYTWQGPKTQGRLSIDGHADLNTGSPHDSDRLDPEHMLLAAAEVCLANTVIAIATHSKLELLGYSSRAEGELEFVDKAGYRFKNIAIVPELTVPPGKEQLAQRVIDKSHRACLVARSLNCQVDVEAIIHSA